MPGFSLAENRLFYPCPGADGWLLGETVKPCQKRLYERTGHIDGAFLMVISSACEALNRVSFQWSSICLAKVEKETWTRIPGCCSPQWPGISYCGEIAFLLWSEVTWRKEAAEVSVKVNPRLSSNRGFTLIRFGCIIVLVDTSGYGFPFFRLLSSQAVD